MYSSKNALVWHECVENNVDSIRSVPAVTLFHSVPRITIMQAVGSLNANVLPGSTDLRKTCL